MEISDCGKVPAWLLLHHHDRVAYSAWKNIQVVIESRLVVRLSNA
jgi:hypothetical protein